MHGPFSLHPFSLQSKRRSPNAVLFHHLREAYGLFPQARKARRRRDPGLFLQRQHGPQTHPPAHPPPAAPSTSHGNLYGLPWKVQRKAFRRPPLPCHTERHRRVRVRTDIRPLHTARGSPPAPARHWHSRRQRSPGWRKALRRARCNAHAPPAHASIPPPLPASCVTWYKRRSRFEDTRMSMDGEDVL